VTNRIRVDGLQNISEALQADDGSLAVIMSSYYLYCDAAGGMDHGFIVVAGYLSKFEQWGTFTAQWSELLATFDIPYFHMKKFSQFKPPFDTEKWKDESRRVRFLSGAARIISANVEQGFASAVDFDAFNRVNKIYRLDDVAGVPYSLAARTCVAKASRFGALGSDTTYIFEDGDEGRGELMRILEDQGYPLPIFRPSRDLVKKGKPHRGVVALQAADFAAYEIRKVYKDDPDELWPIERYRKSLQALAGIPSVWGRYSEQDLIELCRKATKDLGEEKMLRKTA
jgi:hypothetical protein